MEYRVSVIIISWNALNFLQKCLPSLYKKNIGLEFELILIDNNSNDGTFEYIKENYKNIQYIKNTENKGVAPARNQGLRIANGEFILILDVDTEFITQNALSELIRYMSYNEKVGLLGAQLISEDGEIQNSCLKFPSVWVKLLVRLEKIKFISELSSIKNYYMVGMDKETAQEVDYVIGAFQFFRRSLLGKIGIYDDTIFYGPEDIDYCLRIRKAGYQVHYYPKVKVYHYYQRITRKIFSKITFRHVKGLFHFFWKHKYLNYPEL